MPPDGRLPDAQIAVLEQWVKRGLPWSKQEDYGVTEHVMTDQRGDGRDREHQAEGPVQALGDALLEALHLTLGDRAHGPGVDGQA